LDVRNKINSKERLTSRIIPLTIPLDPDEQTGWKPYHQFRGTADNADDFSCHVSVLVQGHCPHPPHTHPEEEILLMLAGEANLILPQMPSSDGNQELPLRRGQFVYYPSHFPHTLRAVSPKPANYLMFKWLALSGVRNGQLGFGCFDALKHRNEGAAEHELRLLFEGPTGGMRKLHSHATTLPPSVGHASHAHAYESAIVLLEGELETLGRRVGPHSIIFYAGGDPHSIHNPGDVSARYVVFEFHGGKAESFYRKITDLQRWKGKLKGILRLS
jgi:quercetin dioxygenase-like cupin family protein